MSQWLVQLVLFMLFRVSIPYPAPLEEPAQAPQSNQPGQISDRLEKNRLHTHENVVLSSQCLLLSQI